MKFYCPVGDQTWEQSDLWGMQYKLFGSKVSLAQISSIHKLENHMWKTIASIHPCTWKFKAELIEFNQFLNFSVDQSAVEECETVCKSGDKIIKSLTETHLIYYSFISNAF